VVDGVDGWMVLPDDWAAPEGLTFVPDFEEVEYDKYEDIPNQYTTDEWAAMEAAGAVFLPNTDLLLGPNDILPMLCYQSRTVKESLLIGLLLFTTGNSCYCNDGDSGIGISCGLPVRLVQLQAGNTIVNVE